MQSFLIRVLSRCSRGKVLTRASQRFFIGRNCLLLSATVTYLLMPYVSERISNVQLFTMIFLSFSNSSATLCRFRELSFLCAEFTIQSRVRQTFLSVTSDGFNFQTRLEFERKLSSSCFQKKKKKKK